MLIDRIIFDNVKNAVSGPDRLIVIVYGPRQAGKTTLIKAVTASLERETLYFTGDDLYAQEILSRHEVEHLKRVLASGKLVIVDEAQKIPNIGLTLKILHDELGLGVIASGSASFDLADKLSEPLTGRTKTFWLYPLSCLELDNKYRKVSPRLALEEQLIYGSYPRVHTIRDNAEKEDYLHEYINKYLYKDILEFSGIKKPKKAVDLLSLLALQTGSEVSVAELSKNLAISQKAVDSYLDILEKMFVIFNLRGFSRNLRKEISKTSKYYFYDTGVRNALLRNFNPLKLRPDAGELFENYFIMEKIKYSENTRQRRNFYFWRTYDQKEIDLIVEGGGRLTGYECKWSAKKTPKAPLDWARTYPEAGFRAVTPENYRENIKF